MTGIFYSGFDEYDRRLMYTALGDTQDLVGRGDQVMGVELKVKDVDRAEEIAKRLEKALGGPPYQVQDWYELNHNLFTALNLQKLALVIDRLVHHSVILEMSGKSVRADEALAAQAAAVSAAAMRDVHVLTS